jgi:uncharacterized protein YwqG
LKELEELIKKYELEEVKDYIYENIKNIIYLNLTEKDNYKFKGVSRVGGYPDVPENFQWPKNAEGKLLTFIAQLNLKEISFCDENALLPKKGMIYFFMGIDEPAYDIEHKVIYIEENEKLNLMKPEKPTVLEEEHEQTFTPYKVNGRNSIEIPNYAYVDYDILEDSDAFFSLEEDIRFENTGDNCVGKVYGYPERQHDDAELEAALKIIAKHQYNYRESEKEILIKALGGNKEKAEQEIHDMVMLLEIDSNDKIGFSWWDSGVIHFFIRKEDLKNKNFDNTYLSLYSS